MTINNFIGLSNKFDPLKHKVGALKSAINVDVDNSNNIRRRSGFAESLIGLSITGSYSTKNRNKAFIIDSNELKNIGSNVTIEDGFTGQYIWDDFNGSVFIYGDKKGIVENDKFLNIDHPVCPAPQVKAVNGNQPAGYYQVSCAYRNNNGREGGMRSPIVMLLEDNQALEITVDQIDNYEVTIYISPVNGKYLYQWQTTSSNTSIWDGPQHLLASPAEDSQFGANSIPDNGNSIVYHKNKLYISEYIPSEGKSVIWFSLPFSYHLFNQSKDYIVINEKVTIIINITTALVICTENSIYYYQDGKTDQIANYGVPMGKPFGLSKNGEYFLWTNNGICKLNPFENLTNKVHELPFSPSVFSAVIEQKGYGRFVNLLSDKTEAEDIFRS